MNIGFDLDKVFINYPPVVPDFIINKLYKEKENGTLKYRIPGKFEQKIRQMSHMPILRKPIKKNIEFLKLLSQKDKDKLYLISSRFGFLEKQTMDLVRKNKFDELFTKVYFNFKNFQPHLFKQKIIRELNIDRYVDDDLGLLKYLAKRNPKTNFFWLNANEKGKITNNLFSINQINNVLKDK